MTDTKTTSNEQEEFNLLKDRAFDLGIKVTSKTKLEDLRDMVNSRLKPKEQEVAEPSLKMKVFYEAMKLVRIRVVCTNQNKKEYDGEYVAAGNSLVPTVMRFVPFEVETHVEQIIYNHMKNRKITYVRYVKDDEGRKIPVTKLRNEFQIEVLPPLTPEELDQLKTAQSKRRAVD